MIFEQLIPVGLTLLLGSFVQGTVGFAYALFVLPILIWLGIPLSHAVAFITVSVLVQVSLGTYRLRGHVKWREVLWGTLLRYLTFPIGMSLLVLVNTLETDRIKQALGGILLITIAAQLVWRIQPRDELHPGWRLLAFSLSGLMHGMAAIGGPPAVLWALAHRWTTQETRSFLFALFLLGVPIQVLLLYLNFGTEILFAMLNGLLFSPLVVVGSMLGIRTGNLISKSVLRRISFAVLSIIALASLVAPFF